MSSPSPTPPPPPPPARRRKRWPLAALLLLLLTGAGVGAYFVWIRKPLPPKPDLEAAMAANLRGVGLMEQHKFPEAEQEFAEAVRLAPDWQTAKINLGIAMLNQQPSDTKTLSEHVEKSKDVFR